MNDSIKAFFSNCEYLDYLVLRPLSHINPNWELMWNSRADEYIIEDDSFADKLNQLVFELAATNPPARYHDNEDALAEYVIQSLNWNLKKIGNRWVGSNYESILEQGGFHDLDEQNLVQAATGRIWAAINRGQVHFDEMEESHQKILAAVLAIILYHRNNR